MGRKRKLLFIFYLRRYPFVNEKHILKMEKKRHQVHLLDGSKPACCVSTGTRTAGSVIMITLHIGIQTYTKSCSRTFPRADFLFSVLAPGQEDFVFQNRISRVIDFR